MVVSRHWFAKKKKKKKRLFWSEKIRSFIDFLNFSAAQEDDISTLPEVDQNTAQNGSLRARKVKK